MGSSSRTFDITVISAHNLKNASVISKLNVSKMNVYAIVTFAGESQTTSVDKDCGKKPTWNHRMRFHIDEAAAMRSNLMVVISIKANGGCFSGADLGQVFVPVKEMLCKNGDDEGGGGREHAKTYRIRTPSGKVNGTLKLTNKIGPPASAAGGFSNPPGPPPKDNDNIYNNAENIPLAYPPPEYASYHNKAYPPPPGSGSHSPAEGHPYPYPHPHVHGGANLPPPPGWFPPTSVGTYYAQPPAGYPQHGFNGKTGMMMNYPSPPRPGAAGGYSNGKKGMTTGMGVGLERIVGNRWRVGACRRRLID